MTSPERFEDQPGFILHGRAYRETSEILEVFTAVHGRTGVVARGSRRPKSRLRSVLQPFRRLSVAAAGRGSLLTLRAAEPDGPAIDLDGDRLMAAFYMNELLLRFLHRGDPHPGLFGAYEAALTALGVRDNTGAVLRRFEMILLDEIGYGLNLGHDGESGCVLEPDHRYLYVPERGPVPADAAAASSGTFFGRELIAVARGDFHDAGNLQAARRLLRTVLDHHLAGKPLRTRQVFAAMRR